ncbi:50S ribosomal protein L9 [uncultured Prevotella sp.]|uniref:50S ribosomal protein L9 n=1 Tax=uncultured Prevotella sp. TaxID=159272 RepID=UPI00261D1A4F|nr:50S ribosomal protein L9 [uncultured Prevotella sp.]
MENINVQVYSLVSEPISPIEKLKTIAKLGFAGAEFTADFTEVPVEEMKKVLAENLKQQAHKLAAIKAAAEKKAEELNGVELVITAKVSATGATYGSVNATTVAAELGKKGIEVDRKIITMRDIKHVGDFEATIHFHKEVEVKVPVKVVAENAQVETPATEATEAPATETPAAE